MELEFIGDYSGCWLIVICYLLLAIGWMPVVAFQQLAIGNWQSTNNK
jgi:hypothetical protein